MTKKIYVASNLGFSEAGRLFLYEKLIPLIESEGFEVLDPFGPPTSNEFLRASLSPESVRDLYYKTTNRKSGKRNEDNIRISDGLIAVLDGVDIDSGTASEIGFAYAQNKKILGYRGDFRLSSDNEAAEVNLQVEYFIKASGGNISHSLLELKQNLNLLK